jgi:peptidoglycan/xylan/chitin deacetylase (PgdA/CDA1 family)
MANYIINPLCLFTLFISFGKLLSMVRKRSRIRRRRLASKKTQALKILFIFVLMFCILITIKGIADLSKSKNIDEKLINETALGNIKLTLPPSTPTPTSIPTPTPVPLVGYCLNVPVIMYHHIQPTAEAQARGQTALSLDNGVFDSQMAYLASSGYSAISAGQLVEALVNHTELPAKSIVITMDDGYNDIYTYAYPILQKYHIIANLGVITGLVGGADYASWGQIEEMSRSGLMYMVNHTWSHYSVTQNSDKSRYEIATAKQQLQDHTGQNIDTFIYPYGAINSSAISNLQLEGVRGAFSEIYGFWQCDSFLMALHRVRIGNSSLASYGF